MKGKKIYKKKTVANFSKKKVAKVISKEEDDPIFAKAKEYHVLKREILAPFIARLLLRNRYDEFLKGLKVVLQYALCDIKSEVESETEERLEEQEEENIVVEEPEGENAVFISTASGVNGQGENQQSEEELEVRLSELKSEESDTSTVITALAARLSEVKSEDESDNSTVILVNHHRSS